MKKIMNKLLKRSSGELEAGVKKTDTLRTTELTESGVRYWLRSILEDL